MISLKKNEKICDNLPRFNKKVVLLPIQKQGKQKHISMRFIVSSLKLLKSLQALGGVIGSKNTLPILDDFLFQLNENELKITASDLDVTMSVAMKPEMVEGIGEVTILANSDLVEGQETAEKNNGVVLLPERVVFTAENVANYPF